MYASTMSAAVSNVSGVTPRLDPELDLLVPPPRAT